jgi:hypothetical protein
MPEGLQKLLMKKAYALPQIDTSNTVLKQEIEDVSMTTDLIKQLMKKGYEWEKGYMPDSDRPQKKAYLTKGTDRVTFAFDKEDGQWKTKIPKQGRPESAEPYSDSKDPKHRQAIGRGEFALGGTAGSFDYIQSTPMMDKKKREKLMDLLSSGGMYEDPSAIATGKRDYHPLKPERDPNLGKMDIPRSAKEGIRDAKSKSVGKNFKIKGMGNKKIYVGEDFIDNIGDGTYTNWANDALHNFSGDPAFQIGFVSPEEIYNIVKWDVDDQVAQQIVGEIENTEDESRQKRQTKLGSLIGEKLKDIKGTNLNHQQITNDAMDIATAASRAGRSNELAKFFIKADDEELMQSIGLNAYDYKIPNQLAGAFYENGFHARSRYVKLYIIGQIIKAKAQDAKESLGGARQFSSLAKDDDEKPTEVTADDRERLPWEDETDPSRLSRRQKIKLGGGKETVGAPKTEPATQPSERELMIQQAKERALAMRQAKEKSQEKETVGAPTKPQVAPDQRALMIQQAKERALAMQQAKAGNINQVRQQQQATKDALKGTGDYGVAESNNFPSWNPIKETEAIYDGSKNKDGEGYFWIGAAGGGGTTSISGEADTAEEDPTGSKGTKKKHGRKRKTKSKK